jgi:hypothetical protein
MVIFIKVPCKHWPIILRGTLGEVYYYLCFISRETEVKWLAHGQRERERERERN